MNPSIILLALSCIPHGGQEGQAEKIRIGTYDNRAIAIACAASKFNPVGEKMKQHEKAKSDGDERKIKELEAWGARHQRELHRQGFGDVPVHDLLAHVKDRIPDVAKAERLTAIVRRCEFVADNVEVVDVTQQLVALFEPSAKTLSTIEAMKDKPFADLDEIDQHDDDHQTDK